jgi:glutamate transport system permease protein
MDYYITALPEIFAAFATTLELTAGAFAIALVVGTLMATLRILPAPGLRAIGTGYVEIFRNLPLLVILIMLVFGLPDAGMILPIFTCMVLGMGLYSGAYVCEAVRSGILSVDRGEVEAARALGFTIPQIMRLVVLPIAFRNMIQPLANVLISTVLATSLAGSLGITELTGIATRLQDKSAQLLLTFALLGLGYVIITLSVGVSASRVQLFLDRKFRTTRQKVR